MTTRLEMKKRQTEVRYFAIEVFGSKRKAVRWLKKPHILYGKSPNHLCKTKKGFDEVRKILNSINYGGVV